MWYANVFRSEYKNKIIMLRFVLFMTITINNKENIGQQNLSWRPECRWFGFLLWFWNYYKMGIFFYDEASHNLRSWHPLPLEQLVHCTTVAFFTVLSNVDQF